MIVAGEVREGGVDALLTKAPRDAKVDRGALDERMADRQLAPLVGEDAGVGGDLQRAFVDQAVPGREVGMLSRAIRACPLADVRHLRRHGETVIAQLICDPHVQCEGVARHRVQPDPHHDAMRLALGRSPGAPPQQAVNRVVPLRLGERDLIVDPIEAVAAIG